MSRGMHRPHLDTANDPISTVMIDRRVPPEARVDDKDNATNASDSDNTGLQNPQLDTLGGLSRSPHPCHHQPLELLELADGLLVRRANTCSPSDTPTSSVFTTVGRLVCPGMLTPTRDSSLPSDSGTEADDEHFLKGLPAPRARLHKGLRGRNEVLGSGCSTPLLSPVLADDYGLDAYHRKGLLPSSAAFRRGDAAAAEPDKRRKGERLARRRKEVARRVLEVLLLVCQGGMLWSNRDVQPLLREYGRELLLPLVTIAALLAIYPLRLVIRAFRREKRPSRLVPAALPTTFDPAPLIYPAALPVFISFLVAPHVDGVIVTNIVLSICAMPKSLIPSPQLWEPFNCAQWVLSCMPCLISKQSPARLFGSSDVSLEVLALLYPLHQTLSALLRHLTTTSLLEAELQLLSIALINLLLLARSPQVELLKSLVWVGGLGLLVLCGQVIRWGVALARVPKWRFRRVPSSSARSGHVVQLLNRAMGSFVRMRRDLAPGFDGLLSDTDPSSNDLLRDEYGENGLEPKAARTGKPRHRHTNSLSGNDTAETGDLRLVQPLHPGTRHNHSKKATSVATAAARKHTPSGRRKRSASSSVRAFFSLTQGQATARKWTYAGYVYACVVVIGLAGVRPYIGRYALQGREPIGWALAYLFGDLPGFRFQVVRANLERWICLPPRQEPMEGEASRSPLAPDTSCCGAGWVQHVRQASLGASNTRLALLAYWLAAIVAGLAAVLRLTPVCEVDTRRKAFHFVMVAILLPATYVDPCYAALALACVLFVFLALEVLRAGQVPPLSRPLAAFLAPFVDGRDLRGPVVVSHIFLLVGCAVPLWLSLAALPRDWVGAALGDSSSGSGGSGSTNTLNHNTNMDSNVEAQQYQHQQHQHPFWGWDVPTRDVSMVSGVVCVGLGDAAASLVGRRWGHRKWLWGGGKSLEGSAAFAAAAFAGLMAASAWLKIGGWPATSAAASVAAAAAANGAERGGAVATAAAAAAARRGASFVGVAAAAESWRSARWWWRALGGDGDNPGIPGLAATARKTAACASLASLTEAVLTGGNDNVVVPVVLWTCVKGMDI